MMSYSGVTVKFWRRGVVALFSALYFVGCVKVDDRLGVDLLPDDQKAIIRMDTLTLGMETYQTLPDSIVSSNLGFVMFGAMNDPDAGVTTASGLMQYLPSVDKDFTFGDKSVADSLWLTLYVMNVLGDTTAAKQKEFYIYELEGGKFIFDSTYYTSVGSMLPNYLSEEPLFKFNFSGGAANSYFQVKLTDPANITSKGWAFIEKLMASTKEDIATDTAFHKRYGGFYITPAPMTPPADAAMIYANISSDAYLSTPFSSFTLYTHSYDNDPTIAKDTLATEYWFLQMGTTFPNTSAIALSHDYSATPIQAAINATGKTSPVYSHSPAGATPKIRFTDAFTQRLNELKGAEYSSLAVNRAEIQIPVTSTAIPFLNRSPQRLGMYYRYQRAYSLIPDYASNFYGSYLQRAKGYYSMDITSYVQRLATKSTTPRDIYPGMPATPQSDYYGNIVGLTYENVFANTFTALDGTKMRVILTYTLIK